MVCSALNLRFNFEWKRAGDAVNSLISLAFGMLLLLFPIFVLIFYNLKKSQYLIKKRDSDFKARYGSVINELNFKRRGRWALSYPLMQLLRKMWLALILVFANNRAVSNMFSVIAQSLVMLTVIGYSEPMIVVS